MKAKVVMTLMIWLVPTNVVLWMATLRDAPEEYQKVRRDWERIFGRSWLPPKFVALRKDWRERRNGAT